MWKTVEKFIKKLIVVSVDTTVSLSFVLLLALLNEILPNLLITALVYLVIFTLIPFATAGIALFIKTNSKKSKKELYISYLEISNMFTEHYNSAAFVFLLILIIVSMLLETRITILGLFLITLVIAIGLRWKLGRYAFSMRIIPEKEKYYEKTITFNCDKDIFEKIKKKIEELEDDEEEE